MLVHHQLGVVLAGDEPGDGLHGAGAVQGDDGGDVLDALGLQPHAHPGHAGGLHLKYAAGLALRQHLEHRCIVHGDIRQPEVRSVLLHHLHGVVQNRQVPQAQKIHFQQPQLLQRHHGVLADDGLVVPGQRYILIYRPLGDDHTGCVGGGVAGHPLQRLRHVDEPANPFIRLIEVGELLGQLQRILDRDVQGRWHQLSHHIHLGIGHVQRPAHIPNGGPWPPWCRR